MLAPRHPRHRFALPGLVALFAFALVVLESCSPGVPSPSVSPAVAPRAAGVDAAAAGTVKIHDGNSESEGPANDPKACQFHIHFFLGAGTSGAWRVDTQPGGQTVLKGAWKSGTQPDVRVPPYPDLHTLPDGQYKLFWSQDGQPGGDKQKVFKVDCSGASTPPKPTPTAPSSAAPTASASSVPSTSPSDQPMPSDSAAASEHPSLSVAPSESADPTVAPEVTSTPGATMAPGPTTTASAPPSARPSGSVEPEATASSSPSPAPSHSVGADRTAKPTTAPDTSTAPATPGAHDLDGTTLLLVVLTALAAAALAVPLPARRR